MYETEIALTYSPVPESFGSNQTVTTANVIRTHAKKPTYDETTAKAILETIPSRKKIKQKPKEMKVYIQINTCTMKKQISFTISHKTAIVRANKQNKKAWYGCIALIILAAASKSEFIILSSQVTKPFFPNNKTNVRDYSTFNAKSFIDDLQNINWNNICKHTDANQSFSRFYKCVNKTINKHAPLRSISNRKQKFLAKPWLTAGLRKSIRVKNNLFYTSDRITTSRRFKCVFQKWA